MAISQMSIHQTMTVPLDGGRFIIATLRENLRRSVPITQRAVPRQRSVMFWKWRGPFRRVDFFQWDRDVGVLFTGHVVWAWRKRGFQPFAVVVAHSCRYSRPYEEGKETETKDGGSRESSSSHMHLGDIWEEKARVCMKVKIVQCTLCSCRWGKSPRKLGILPLINNRVLKETYPWVKRPGKNICEYQKFRLLVKEIKLRTILKSILTATW